MLQLVNMLIKKCELVNCDNEILSNKMCSYHYYKHRRSLPHIAKALRESAVRYRKSEKGKISNRAKTKRWRELNPEKYIYWLAHSRAKEKQVPFTIKVEDIKIPKFCPILGIPLFRGKIIVCPNSPTLDRLKPELGYTPENIAVISRRANELKNNMTLEQVEVLYRWMKAEYAKRNTR